MNHEQTGKNQLGSYTQQRICVLLFDWEGLQHDVKATSLHGRSAIAGPLRLHSDSHHLFYLSSWSSGEPMFASRKEAVDLPGGPDERRALERSSKDFLSRAHICISYFLAPQDTTNGGMQIGSSVRICAYTLQAHFCSFGANLFAHSVIINKTSALLLNRKFIKVALLAICSPNGLLPNCNFFFSRRVIQADVVQQLLHHHLPELW